MHWQLLLVFATWTTQVYLAEAQVECHPLCLSCYGPRLDQCLECRQYSYNNTCVQRCPTLTFTVRADPINSTVPSNDAFPTTKNISADPDNATLTGNDTLQNTATPTEVVPGNPTTGNRGTCEDCHPECQVGCYGNTSRDCYRCKHVAFDGTCLSCCPEGSYLDPKDSSFCRRCHGECERGCTGPGPANCHRCKHVQHGGRCLHTCPDNTYQTPGTPSVCRPCHNTCEDGCVGPGTDDCAPLRQNSRGSHSMVLPLVLTLGAVVAILLASCLVVLVRKRQKRSRKPPSSPTRNLACYQAGSISTIAIPLGPEQSSMSDLYRNVCLDNATFTNDSDDDVDVSPTPSLIVDGGRSDDNSSSISGCADTVSEGAVSNESRSTDSTVVRVPIPSSERQANFGNGASQQALDKMAAGWRYSYLTDDSGIVSDGSRCSTMDNQSRWSVATSGTVGSGDSRIWLQDASDTAVNREQSKDSCDKDVRRTSESLQGAPSDKEHTADGIKTLSGQSADREDTTLTHLLSKFRDIVGDSEAAGPDAVNFSTPRFVAGIFDRRGGHLTLENLGIDLYIPPDAVEHDGTEIFMYARGADESSTQETGKKWRPPVIQCGPHGLKFNRHAILTVKHPAEDLKKWSFKFQASNTDVGETPDWKDLTQDTSALCFAYGDKTVIFVDHFTLYNVSGELIGADGEDEGEKVEWRRFRVGVFAEPLFLDTEIFQLRVRCWQDNDNEQQRSREKERYLGAVQLGDDKVLHLAGDGGNLSVVLERLRTGWLAFNGDRQTIPFSSLWNEHSEMPSCTFDIERQPSGLVPKTVVCKVTALQVSYPDNTVSIDVLKQLHPRQAPERPSVSSLDSESTFLRLQPELRPTPRCVPQFPGEEQFGLLCLVLDVEDPAGRDWRSVAETLHLSFEFIQWMKQRGDPTRRMLDFLVAQHGGDSLRVLRDALMASGHERAQQMVEAMMGTSHHGPVGQYSAAQQRSSDGQPFAGMWSNDDMRPSSNHNTTPKRLSSSSVFSPGSLNLRSGDCSETLPVPTQQPASTGTTSRESTTVEKVSGDRSLGDGQEADASMPSIPNITPEIDLTAQESNSSITVPKTLRTQDSGYHSPGGETNLAFTMEDETGGSQRMEETPEAEVVKTRQQTEVVDSGSAPHADESTTEADSSKVNTNQDAEENSAPPEKSTTPWPLLMNLKNKMSIRSKSLPDLLWGQNKTDAAKQANKNISDDRLSQTM
ncbi:uncharacterized protein [Branchiostoma lanceolatum]|uniref:uncharacterized protein isoform X2 n=1 Tax=Branchiostoma lanceolatum TaxID=7740 RepID=UPI003451DDDC